MNLFKRLLRYLTGDRPQGEEPAAAEMISPAAPPDPASPIKVPAVPDASADPYFTAAPAAILSSSFKAKATLGLDARAYLPITREEIKKTAKGTNLFANAWFGRRD